MSGVQAPGERSGVWQTLGDLLRRVRALEAVPASSTPPPGSGIQFDTYPQDGDWLYAETTGVGGPHSVGVDLEISNALRIRAASGIVIEDIGPVPGLAGGTTIREDGGGIIIEDIGGGLIDISTPTGTNATISITADGNLSMFGKGIQLTPTVNGLDITLPAGMQFTIYDSTTTPMLQMTEGSPDLHIPTGGTVVADL